jgi:hypothetical protein
VNAKGARVPPPEDAVLAMLAARIRVLIPEIDTREVRAAVEEVAGSRTAAAQLGRYLETTTSLLVSPSSAVPLVVIRLAHALHPAAPERIVLPACTGCGRALEKLPTVTEDGRRCHTCTTRGHQPRCASCGKNTKLKDTDGVWQCRACRGRAYRSAERAERRLPKEACAKCGNVRWILKRLEDGGGLCGSCNPYQPPKKTCIACGRERPVHARTPDGPVCGSCHKRPAHTCGVCSKVGKLYRRERDGEPAICPACYQKPKTVCEGCGKLRHCARNRATGGTSICAVCRTRKIECARCGRLRPFAANLPLGAVCGGCYSVIRRQITACPRCGRDELMIARDADGTPICGPCAGRAVDYSCKRCGVVALKGAGGGLCYACAATDRINALLANYASADRDQVAAAIVGGRSGEAVWQYLEPGAPAAALIERLVATGKPLSHALLDAEAPSPAVHRLRALLMHPGVLPERADHLERIVPWMQALLAEQPPTIAQPIETWMRWRVLRRARRRTERRPFTPAAAHAVRSQVRATLRFLTWLDAQQLTLAALTQPVLERWLTQDGGPGADEIRDFLTWAQGRGLAKELTVPIPTPREALVALEEDERWEHLRRALTDEGLPSDLRTAAALMLLYGLTFSRIQQLRRDEIEERSDGLYLALDRRGGHRLRLAEPVGDLLTRHLTNTAGALSDWVFPGTMPGQPVSEGLRQRLRRAGFPNLARARAAALITLLEDVPPPVLASLLGLHPATAERWARYAQPDWSAYLDARTATASPL